MRLIGYHMLNFIAIDLQLYKTFKITLVAFFGTHYNHIKYIHVWVTLTYRVLVVYVVYPYYRVWLTRLSHAAFIYRVHLVQTLIVASRVVYIFHQFCRACISCCFWRQPSSPESVCDKRLSHCTKIEKSHVTKATPLQGYIFMRG